MDISGCFNIGLLAVLVEIKKRSQTNRKLTSLLIDFLPISTEELRYLAETRVTTLSLLMNRTFTNEQLLHLSGMTTLANLNIERCHPVNEKGIYDFLE